VLTRADQVRRLTPEQAAQGYRVRIRGVITDDVPAPDFFVQDSYAGIYVEGSKLHSFAHHFGDLVEVEGITGPGKFAPVIREENLRVLGKDTCPRPVCIPSRSLPMGNWTANGCRFAALSAR